MSRSRKLPIYKDGPRSHKKSSIYWRTIRRIINERVRFYHEFVDDEVLPEPQEIINDYDYCDWIYDSRFVPEGAPKDDKEWAARMSRK